MTGTLSTDDKVCTVVVVLTILVHITERCVIIIITAARTLDKHFNVGEITDTMISCLFVAGHARQIYDTSG